MDWKRLPATVLDLVINPRNGAVALTMYPSSLDYSFMENVYSDGVAKIGGPATIKDVARVAGVSIATVSRALHKPDRVNDDTAQRVRDAARALRYVTDLSARSLVSRRFQRVGAVFPTIDNAIFAKAIHALQRELIEHGFTMLIASTEYHRERELVEIQSMIEHGVDGIVLVGLEHDVDAIRLMEAHQIPFVRIWSSADSDPWPCIGFDNYAAMTRMCGYLMDLGHRRFAMIAGITRDNDRASQRLAGAHNALATRGLTLAPEFVIERPYSIADGRTAMRALLSRPQPPTAVLCGNDVLAFGALFECQAAGIKVPQAVSIAGFDDFELSSHVVPSLTTMRVPAVEMGRQAADFLAECIAGRNTPARVLFEAELIVRGSTASPLESPPDQ